MDQQNKLPTLQAQPITSAKPRIKLSRKIILVIGSLLVLAGLALALLSTNGGVNQLLNTVNITNPFSSKPGQNPNSFPQSLSPDKQKRCEGSVCATCGDGICEESEVCGPVVGRGYTTSDCGPLFCKEDCKNLLPSE